MSQSPLFDAAKARILSDLEHYFPDGESRNGEWWWRRRDGDKTPSCHAVGDTAAVKDFGDDGFRGSVLDCYAELHGMSAKDAAKEIAPEAARPERSRSKEKVAPVLPVPAEALSTLRQYVKSEWAIDKYGECTLGSRYEDAQGRTLFCVARYERAGKKEIRPYYYGVDGKWHEGQALPHDRPILHLPEVLSCALPVLIVEGEKCASVEVAGYVVVSWAGGSSAVEHTDWSPLAEREVIVWPDADGPGLKAAAAIKRRLPKARVLQIEGRPQGWDCADAHAEGVDLAAFISSCPLLEMPGDPGAKLPFSFLGYDNGRYHFLPRKRRVPFTIDMGQFSPSRLLELAPLGWWGASGMIKDNGAIKTDSAQDWIIEEQEKVGMVDIARLRGAGVWKDGEQIVVNDGAQIVTMTGESLEYDAFPSAVHAEYIPSETRFGDMTGPESTDEDGSALADLFVAQRFAAPSFALYALGWSLISCFGGLLAWRPHIWITGRKGTGKSWAIENLIGPLCGDFASKWGSRASEPGIRRTLKTDARPVIVDEMEPKNKAAVAKIDALTDLARNSSCDASSRSVLASGEGTVTFMVRSCFCFASVQAPEMNAANESRIMRLELQPLQGDEEREKKDASRCAAALLKDAARFRRRIFRALPRIMEDIEYLRETLPGTMGDQREVDMWAPILSAAWAVQSGESIQAEGGKSWLIDSMNIAMKEREAVLDDEERVIEHILESTIRTDEMRTRTVAELLSTAEGNEGGSAEARALLGRYGLTVTNIKNGDGRTHRYLAIAQNSKALEKMLEGTPYEHGYDQQIRRHRLCKGGEAQQVKVAGKNTRCRILSWGEFRSQYLGDTQGRLEGVDE